MTYFSNRKSSISVCSTTKEVITKENRTQPTTAKGLCVEVINWKMMRIAGLINAEEPKKVEAVNAQRMALSVSAILIG
jgi:hypothetical protein